MRIGVLCGCALLRVVEGGFVGCREGVVTVVKSVGRFALLRVPRPSAFSFTYAKHITRLI